MKKCFTVLITLACSHIQAQLPFSTRDSININNLNALASPYNLLWHHEDIFDYRQCRFPKGNQSSVVAAGTVWLSGYDESNQLHVSAQTYRQDGVDFWPGPIDANGEVTYASSYAWAKIWKVDQAEIQAFRAIFKHTRENTPYSILTWPGKGNVYARGNMSSPLEVDKDMAPFADLNGNGTYEPLSGEYPKIKGDQALWWVFSDNGPTHEVTKGRPMRVEVSCMAYGYSRNTLLDNVVYYEYEMKNRSASSYHDVRMAFWTDVRIGLAAAGHIGFDSTHRLSIWYNRIIENTFGETPPVGGITIVRLPGDNTGIHPAAGSFGYYVLSSGNDSTGAPRTDTSFSNYMRARWNDGVSFTNNYAGPGSLGDGRGVGRPCKYVLPGDPKDSTTWSACYTGRFPYFVSTVLSTSDFDLPAGATEKVVFALVVAPRDSSNFCSTISFDKIREVADTAWGNYYNPPPVSVNSHISVAGQLLKLYPNPAQSELYVMVPDGAMPNTQIRLYNTLGQQLAIPFQEFDNGYTANIETLVPGMYHITYSVGGHTSGGTFLKK